MREKNNSSKCGDRILRCAIAGIGGFGECHHKAMLLLEKKKVAKLVATCDPLKDKMGALCANLKFSERGCGVYSDYEAMLNACGPIDYVVLVTPIPLHASMHSQAVARKIPVYLEKPPTLDPSELEQMIATDAQARFTTAVGFNLISDPVRFLLKSRLLAGEFGEVRECSFVGRWPRPDRYFNRNNWAGRLTTPDGRLLLDSCFSNAMSHYVHNLLFWSGKGEMLSWADVVSAKARLFRANPIEGADTFFVEARTSTNVTLRFAMTHACLESKTSETIWTQKAKIIYAYGSHYEIHWNDGRCERFMLPQSSAEAALADSVENYCDYLNQAAKRPNTRLCDCRAFVRLNALAYLSSREITDMPAAPSAKQDAPGFVFSIVKGLEEATEVFAQKGIWPEVAPNKLVMGGQTPSAATPDSLGELRAVVARMKQASLARSLCQV